MPVRLEPRDRLVVGPQFKIRPAPRRPGRPAAEQVVSKHPQGVDHRQQLQDVCRVVPLGRRQLAILVHHRLLPALVVWLRRDSRYAEVAGVSSQDRAAGGIKRAQHLERSSPARQRST